MTVSQLKFQLKGYPKFERVKSFCDVQKSVDLLFGILDEYARWENTLRKKELKICV